MREMFLAFFIIIIVLAMITNTAGAQNQFESQMSLWAGADGDQASRGNLGVQVEIRTHIYNARQSDLDFFFVGDDLDNGASIRFGYSFEPGDLCLKGKFVGGVFTCLGESGHIGSSDARWQLRYVLNEYGTEFYLEIGPSNSAGMDGTWHLYSIVRNEGNGWSFLIDGRRVANVPFQWTKSRTAAHMVAEKVTTSEMLANLGPVEFRNLSYLKEDGWHQVSSLNVIRQCVTSKCPPENPYGVSQLGPNYILAGSGGQKLADGTLLWSRPLMLTIEVPPTAHTIVDGADQGAGSVHVVLTDGLHAVTVPAIVQIDNATRLRFSSWSDGSNFSARSVELYDDLTLRAAYVRQHLLKINSIFNASGSGWYDEGSLSTLSVPSLIGPMNGLLGLLGGKWVFSGWYEGGRLLSTSSNASFTVNEPHTLEARWQPDYTRPILILGVAAILVITAAFLAMRRSTRNPPTS